MFGLTISHSTAPEELGGRRCPLSCTQRVRTRLRLMLITVAYSPPHLPLDLFIRAGVAGAAVERQRACPRRTGWGPRSAERPDLLQDILLPPHCFISPIRHQSLSF